jgi:hypothetical protein
MAISLLKLPLPSDVASNRSVYKLVLSGPGEHRYALPNSSFFLVSRSFLHQFSNSQRSLSRFIELLAVPSIVAFVFPA